MSRRSLMASDEMVAAAASGSVPARKNTLMRLTPGSELGLHVVDAAGKGELALEMVGDVGFNLLRRHAGVEGGDGDHRQVDGREHVDGHIRDTDGAEDRDEESEHHDDDCETDYRPNRRFHCFR